MRVSRILAQLGGAVCNLPGNRVPAVQLLKVKAHPSRGHIDSLDSEYETQTRGLRGIPWPFHIR